MVKGLDRSIAKKLYERMKRENSSLRYIQDVFQITFAEAKEEDVLLLLASCINETPEPSKITPPRQRREPPRDSFSYQDSSCTGSSSKAAC